MHKRKENCGKLYNELLEIYFNQYTNFSFSKARKLGTKFHSKNFFLNDYKYDFWYKELDDKTLKK